jgi:hypothetical protein
MFIALLLTTLVVAVLITFFVARAFESPIRAILTRIVGADMAEAWTRYMKFAMYVVGVSGGVRLYALEQYLPQREIISPEGIPIQPPQTPLTAERWMLELFQTAIDTLQALAWLLLFFFLFAMVAFVIIRIWGGRKEEPDAQSPEDAGGD